MYSALDFSDRGGYIISQPDLDGFIMPNKFYREGSMDYKIMKDKYLNLNNNPRFNCEVIPIGIMYGLSQERTT